MKRLTLSIPDELKSRMDARPGINWPSVIKEGLKKRLEQLEKLKLKGELW